GAGGGISGVRHLVKPRQHLFGTDRQTRERSVCPRVQKQREENKEKIEEGEKFLAKNAKRKEVKTTASGLQYEVITEGTGDKPAATNTVKVHYKGTTIAGKVFDSSYDRGTPAEFPLNRVIAGWTEGLQLMSVGSKYKFYIPYNLAYGERGAGQDIKPFETLIFEVELLEIKK
ncbi:MAG: FKBP-type peptidyl-prolyl cis-trans isomerase, partial [Bacteroidales bacterium]|nr:FKBP-type peptidyl-prolyl cis-trans isomerase [Bacteroidales bacterium]